MGLSNSKLKILLKFIIGWPLSIIALIFILKLFLKNGRLIIVNFKELNLLILFYSIVCFLFYFLLRSFLWQKILKYKGYPLVFKKTAFLWAWSELKRYIPGNIWGVLGRAFSFSQEKISNKTVFSSLIIEAQLIVVGAMISSFIFLPFIFENLLPNFYNRQILIVILDSLAILTTFIFVFNSLIFKLFIKNKNSFITKLFKFILTDFTPIQNFYLLVLSISIMFIFGIAIYFSIASILYLTPTYFFLFVGFFIFCFLVGYLSIITPMGLGVREIVLTIGLSKFATIASAGFAAIFSRIIFIISELLFIILTFTWKNTKSKVFLKIESFINDHKHETILVFLIFIYIIYFTTLSFLRYENFYTGRFDLGNMDQTVWNTMRGRIFQLTDPNGTSIISRLAFHADFILILLSPFYLIWSDPRMLLLIQTLILSLGSVFVFLLAKKSLNNKNLSLAFAIAYLLNPSIQHVNLYDFHAVTLATTFLLGAFYFLKEKKYLPFLFFAVFSAFTKENVWLTVAFFGVYIILQSFYRTVKNKRYFTKNLDTQILGILIFLISIAVFYYLVWYAIPGARGGNHFALTYYSDFGNSPTDVVRNIIFAPFKTFKVLLQKDQLEYLLKLFIPLGFLPLFSLSTLLFVSPDFIINLLSNNSQLRQIYFQYTSTITPFLFISAIYAIKNIRKLFPKIPSSYFILYLILGVFYSVYFYGPLIGAKNPNADMIAKPQNNKDEINKVLSKIRKRYTIAVTNNLGSHLSHRQRIYTIPIGIDKAEILAFLINNSYFPDPSIEAQKKLVKELKANRNYRIIYEKEGFVVFQKLK